MNELTGDSLVHELEGNGSLRKCRHCGRWFHNEADAGYELEECDARLRMRGSEGTEER